MKYVGMIISMSVQTNQQHAGGIIRVTENRKGQENKPSEPNRRWKTEM